MKIKDLKPSILELDYGEALQRISNIRKDRHILKQKKKKAKTVVNIEFDPGALSPEMARKLLETLGVKIDE